MFDQIIVLSVAAVLVTAVIFCLEVLEIGKLKRSIAVIKGRLAETEKNLKHALQSPTQDSAQAPQHIPSADEGSLMKLRADLQRVTQEKNELSNALAELKVTGEEARRQNASARDQQAKLQTKQNELETDLAKAKDEREEARQKCDAAHRERDNARVERERLVAAALAEANKIKADAARELTEAKSLESRSRSRFLPEALQEATIVTLVDGWLKADSVTPLENVALARVHQITGLLPLSNKEGADLRSLHTALRDLGQALSDWLHSRETPASAAEKLGEIASAFNAIALGLYELRAVKTGDSYDADMMEATPRPEFVSRVKGWAVFTGKGARVSRAAVT